MPERWTRKKLRENKRKGGIGLGMLAGIVLETGSIRKDNKEKSSYLCESDSAVLRPSEENNQGAVYACVSGRGGR